MSRHAMSTAEGDRICKDVLRLVAELVRTHAGTPAAPAKPETTGTGWLHGDVRDAVMKRSA
jgi:hypothetical protein